MNPKHSNTETDRPGGEVTRSDLNDVGKNMDHLERLMIGFWVVVIGFVVSAFGAAAADAAGIGWYIGAVAVHLVWPLTYSVGYAVDVKL